MVGIASNAVSSGVFLAYTTLPKCLTSFCCQTGQVKSVVPENDAWLMCVPASEDPAQIKPACIFTGDCWTRFLRLQVSHISPERV
jgi:hypothetical protein